jgi:hypothetical protein
VSRHLDLETLSALLDGELETSAADGAQAHVVECQDCRGRLEGLRVTIGELQKLPPAVPPAHVREALRRQLAVEQEVRRRLWALPGWHTRLAAWPAMAAAVFLAFGCGLFLYAYMMRQGAARPAPVAAPNTAGDTAAPGDEWSATITFDRLQEKTSADAPGSAVPPAVMGASAPAGPPPPAAAAPQAAAERLAKREVAAPAAPPAVVAQAETPPAAPAIGGRTESELRDATVGSEAAAEPMSAAAAPSETRNRELSRRDADASAASRADGLAEQKALADEEVLTLGPGIERPVKLSGANPDLPSFRDGRAPPPLIVIEATIGSDGRLRDLRFRPADLDPRIAERLGQTLATWRFQPARKAGRPVAVRYTLTLNIHFQ